MNYISFLTVILKKGEIYEKIKNNICSYIEEAIEQIIHPILLMVF